MKNELAPPFEGKSWLQLAIDAGDCPDHYVFEFVRNDASKIKMLASEIRANAFRELLQFMPKDKNEAYKVLNAHQLATVQFMQAQKDHPFQDMIDYLVESLDWKTI